MSRSRVTLLILSIFAITAATALAASGKDGEAQPVWFAPLEVDAKESEIEPNNNCGQADGPLLPGSGWEGEITPADMDYFRFVSEPDRIYVFETIEASGLGPVDTWMTLYAADCATELAANDDGGTGYFSQINRYFPTAETYFVAVRGYDGSASGHYILVTLMYEVAANNHCGEAIDLHEHGLQQFILNTCTGSNVYNPGLAGCTGYDMVGPDLVYKIELGGTLDVSLESDHDLALYLVNSCGDVSLSCVAGSDDFGQGGIEQLTYPALDQGTYYLMVDSDAECGFARLVIHSPTESRRQSWGNVKSLYR